MTRVLQALGLMLLLLAATPAQAQSAFPVTIEHAFGSTTITAPPKRVVTWGWAAQDAALALGVAPVAIPFFGYGGDDNGMLAWTKKGYEDLGAPMPLILDNSGDAPPIEQIAAAAPDLIIAVYSGLTAEQYQILSQIAPVVAYPETPWATPWQDVIRITGKALGKGPEAETLASDLLDWARVETAKHPELAGVDFAGIAEFNDAVAVYAGNDPRIQFLTDIGMTLASSVTALAPAGNAFFYALSFEQFDALKSGILIAYFASPSDAEAFYARPYVANVAQVKSGAVATLTGADYINAVSPPTALSLKWGFAHYIELIAAAAAKAKP